MELPRSSESAEYSGDITVVHNFDIDPANKGLIFKILRSKMYSDPIGSICREISSNCRDAHREVKTPNRPIEIELIQEFWGNEQPHIIFRDYGPGLSPDRVANIYTKYGSSTKRDSNEQSGGFGLGGKTPFSYTDSFCVVTVVNKIKYTYNLVIEETEEGRMILLGEEPTQESNKTEVIIPINSKKDIEEFHSKSLIVTKFWNPRPIFKGFTISSEVSYEIIEETPEYLLIKEPGSRYNRKTPVLNCLVDGIFYPIPDNSDKWPIRQLDENYSILLKVGNGVISVSSNRETLNYDKKTNDFITLAYKKIKAKAHSKIVEVFNNYTTLEKAFMSYLIDRDTVPPELQKEKVTIIKYRMFDMYSSVKLPELFSRKLRYMKGYEVRISDPHTLEIRVRTTELHHLASLYMQQKFPIYWTDKSGPPSGECRTALMELPAVNTSSDGVPTLTNKIIYVLVTPTALTSDPNNKKKLESEREILKNADISCIDTLTPTMMRRRKRNADPNKSQSYILYANRTRGYGRTIVVKKVDKVVCYSTEDGTYKPLTNFTQNPNNLFFPLSQDDKLSPNPTILSTLHDMGVKITKNLYFVPISTQQALKIQFNDPKEAFQGLNYTDYVKKLPANIVNSFFIDTFVRKYHVSQYEIKTLITKLNDYFQIEPKVISLYDMYNRTHFSKENIKKLDETLGTTKFIDEYEKTEASLKIKELEDRLELYSKNLGKYLWKLIAEKPNDRELMKEINTYYKGLNLNKEN